MIWAVLILMLLGALAIVAVPLYRRNKALLAAVCVILMVVISGGLYGYIGAPDVTSATSAAAATTNGSVASIEEMVNALQARMVEQPDNLEGWKMLGRSYMELGNMPQAIDAFERAVELENGENGETLISLGEAILSSDRSTIEGRAGQLFESGLALEPNSPRGLFYGGFSAIQRGDRELAADRWEALLALSPPPEIRGVLEQRVAEWRGEPPPAAAPAVADAYTDSATTDPSTISINVSVGDPAITAGDAAVFVIARDPAAPSPPLAVVRLSSGDLPGVLRLSDANAMMAGRLPSNYDELEIIVRVSRSGQPVARSGDWYGEATYRRADTGPVELTVDQQVP